MLLASARDIPHWGALTHRQDCLNPSLSCSGNLLDRITYSFRLARAQASRASERRRLGDGVGKTRWIGAELL